MRMTILAASLLLVAVVPAAAQKKKANKPWAGTWEVMGMAGPRDSVVATTIDAFHADGSGTMMAKGRDPIRLKVIAAGGDSVVSQSTRYKSLTRKGVTTRITSVLHFRGDTTWGVTHATYSDGSTADFKMRGTRKK